MINKNYRTFRRGRTIASPRLARAWAFIGHKSCRKYTILSLSFESGRSLCYLTCKVLIFLWCSLEITLSLNMPRSQAELINRKLRTAVKNAEGIAQHVQIIERFRQQKDVKTISSTVTELQEATFKVAESVERLETVPFTASQKDVHKPLTHSKGKSCCNPNRRLRKPSPF